MEHVPLRIEFSLVTPWCPPDLGLHLDGLIAYAAVQEAEAQDRVFGSYDEILAELPFAKHSTDAGWAWQASLVTPVEVLGSERRYLTSKTSVSDFAERMANGDIVGKPLSKIDTVRGPYKNDAIYYTVQHVNTCRAYCVGNPDRIAALLDHITHIGRRTRIGHGQLDADQTVIEQDDEALTRWQERQMPCPIEGYVPLQARLQPPYWAGEGRQTVWRPL